MEPVDHVWLDQLEVGYILITCLELDKFADFLELLQDKWGISITLGMDES